MSRILNLQKLESVGIENAGIEAVSTCSYLLCGNSTYSCRDCCGVTCQLTEET